jgi:uncharacterized membrane protein YqjE
MEQNSDDKKSAWSQQPLWVKLGLIAIILLIGSLVWGGYIWVYRGMIGTAAVLLIMAAYLDYRDWRQKKDASTKS